MGTNLNKILITVQALMILSILGLAIMWSCIVLEISKGMWEEFNNQEVNNDK